MTDKVLPPLALALAAATSSRLHLKDDGSALRDGFVPAVTAMDEADRAYRRAIEKALPAKSATAVLDATAAFREKVHGLRERARREIGALYRRSNRAYGSFDPLDPYTPSAAGLTHVDGTRVAAIADSARSEVDRLRANANDAVVKALPPAQIDALIVAKRRRRDAFEAGLRTALLTMVAPQAGLTASDLDKTLAHLTQLADGWY